MTQSHEELNLYRIQTDEWINIQIIKISICPYQLQVCNMMFPPEIRSYFRSKCTKSIIAIHYCMHYTVC